MGERGPQPGEGGRPRAVIDLDVARRAAALGCDPGEIAALLGIGRRTLYDHLEQDEDLKDAIDEGRAQGRVTLRRLQWKQAHEGNPTMLIWLGKQLLGQRDKTDVAQEVGVSVTFQHLVAMREIGERIVAELMMQQGGTVIDGVQPLNGDNGGVGRSEGPMGGATSTEMTLPASLEDLGAPARE